MKNLPKRIALVVLTLYVVTALIFPAVPSTHAATLPNHVVINEFEQYPVGGDYSKQWIEIYNPTYTPVNIGNWKIVSDGGITRTIPADTIVPANGYYVYQFTGIVLIHTNEMITLKDASNNVVDVTAKKSSTTASASTWQRYPNGVDTNSDADWQFRPATKWRSNGGETVSISISSSSMTLGDSVTVSGTVDPGHVTFVRIQASTDGGATWQNITFVATTATGAYSYVILTPDVGSYMFRVVLPFDNGVLSGTVSLMVNKLPSQITVFAPKTVKTHESASLTGFISPIRSSATVSLKIGMPNGTYITRSATTNMAGYFNFTFAPDAKGRWNVTASWTGDSKTQGATSSVVFFNVEAAEELGILTFLLLLIIPVVIVMIILGLALGRPGRRVPQLMAQPMIPPRRYLPRMPRRLIPMRPRVLPARVCPRCGGPLIYSVQYQRWFCPRCRRHV